jgi:hypothetical protein
MLVVLVGLWCFWDQSRRTKSRLADKKCFQGGRGGTPEVIYRRTFIAFIHCIVLSIVFMFPKSKIVDCTFLCPLCFPDTYDNDAYKAPC